MAETPRFQLIDDQNRGAHFHLTADDKCYFLFEYTSGQGYSWSSTNSLISNLKKKPSLAKTAQYKYKTQAISDCAKMLGAAMNPDWLKVATLVPVPPSKMRSDAEYDDRMVRICGAIPGATDIRELVVQNQSLAAFHEGAGQRLSVGQLRAAYEIDEAIAAQQPTTIGIVDDVLTAGTHFRAMQSALQQRFPGIPIVGVFVARRVFPPAAAVFDAVEIE